MNRPGVLKLTRHCPVCILMHLYALRPFSLGEFGRIFNEKCADVANKTQNSIKLQMVRRLL